MSDTVGKLEMESAERRRSDILYNGLWRYCLGAAILGSIFAIYEATHYFYFKSHQEREFINLLDSCLAVLIPWMAAGATYKHVKARIVSSGSSELLPAFRFSLVVGLCITYFALTTMLSLCGTTR